MGTTRAAVRSLGVAFALALTAVTADGQSVTYTHTYPFHQSRTIVADVDGSDVTLYEGAGAGVFVLDEANLEPSLKSGVANELRAGGFVRDVDLTDDHMYVACHRGGLTRFERGTTSDLPDWSDQRFADAWSVEVADRIGDDDLVFVGTNDDFYDYGPSGGLLHLVRTDADAPYDAPLIEATIDLGAPIYSLASVKHGNTVTLLVGTACRKVGNDYQALLRYDFDVSSGFPQSFPAPTTWNPTAGGNSIPTFVRDIVIDSDDYAYVAAYTQGIYKVDISSGLSTAGGNWPIRAGGMNRSYFMGLDLHESATFGKLLVAARGPTIEVERTIWGECTLPTPCDDVDESLTPKFGVSVYDISSGDPVSAGSFLDTNLLALDVASFEDNGMLAIATAGLQKGLVMLQLDPTAAPGARVSQVAEWDVDDGVPTGQFDDLIQIGDSIFVGVENALAAFDATDAASPGADFLEDIVDIAGGGGIDIAGVEAGGGFPRMVFSSAQLGGVSFYEVQGDGPTTQITHLGKRVMTEMGEMARTYTVATIPPTETPDGHPWLIAINSFDTATESDDCARAMNGSVRVYRITMDAAGQISPARAEELGAYAPSACDLATGRLIGGHAFVQGDDIRVLVGYSPRAYAGTPEQVDAGLLFLTFEFDEGDPNDRDDDGVRVLSSNYVPAFEDAEESPSALIHYKTSHGIVTAALGCNGIATYSLAEVLLDSFTPPNPAAFMHAAAGPQENIYCTTMDGQLWVFDPLDLDPELARYDTPGQAAFIAPAPSQITGAPAFFLTDFRSGLHRIQFSAVPGS